VLLSIVHDSEEAPALLSPDLVDVPPPLPIEAASGGSKRQKQRATEVERQRALTTSTEDFSRLDAPSARLGAVAGPPSQVFFRPLAASIKAVNTPVFSLSAFQRSAAAVAARPALLPGDAELLAAAAPLELPPTDDGVRPAGGGAGSMMPRPPREEPVRPSKALGVKTAANLKRGHTQWGEDDPLRSARPSEQGRREARKELLYRSYHPQLVSLTAQQRMALEESAGAGEREPLLQPGETLLLRIAVYDGRLRERAYLLHGGTTLLELGRAVGGGCGASERLRAQFAEAARRGLGLPLPSGSSMFYIEGRFYIDGAEDLSEPVRTWAAARAESRGSGGGPSCGSASFSSPAAGREAPEGMGATRVGELELRLGG